MCFRVCVCVSVSCLVRTCVLSWVEMCVLSWVEMCVLSEVEILGFEMGRLPRIANKQAHGVTMKRNLSCPVRARATSVALPPYLLHARSAHVALYHKRASEDGNTMTGSPCTSEDIRILVEVPFTAADVPVLLRSQSLWSSFLPCAKPSLPNNAAITRMGKHPHGLLFMFNRQCTTSTECMRVKTAVHQAMPSSVQHCFGGGIMMRDANLRGHKDVYDKLRRTARWAAGPNNVFHRAILIARQLGYTHMMQMEPDVLPFRSNWIEHAACVISQASGAWVIGSPLRANCTREETTKRCVSLPTEIADHINGNAIYLVNDTRFARFLEATREAKLGRMPFDLAIHLQRGIYDRGEQHSRSLFHHSDYVLNYGTTLPEPGQALRERYPHGFLVHSSELARLDRLQMMSHFNPDPTSSPHELDLRLVEERAKVTAQGDRLIIVTFVAGTRYRQLCRNHILHLKRAQVANYILAALDASSLQWLRNEHEPVLDATQLVSGIPMSGSDRFGSPAFFAINGARYLALLAMLSSGISLFVLDLDVVVLSDPIKWLARRENSVVSEERRPDLLLQSDARDGISKVEKDPDLVDRRLGLHTKSEWTYVNGGTFFCRATPSSVALFQRIWTQLSSYPGSTPPNEQDVLNRELARDVHLRWKLLPPSTFPNGFIHFLRPIADFDEAVLVHANWIDGIEAKVYHLREAGVWIAPDEQHPLASERLLSIGEGTGIGPHGTRSITAHWRALHDALVLAHILNRTLVLPSMPISQHPTTRAARTVAHFFDYKAFAEAFPRHRAHGSQATENGKHAAKVHLDVGLDDSPPSKGRFNTIRLNAPGTITATTELSRLLEPWSGARELHLWTSFRLFSGHRSFEEGSSLGSRLRRGIQLAPRLQGLAHFAHRAIRRFAQGSFDCIDASVDREYEPLLLLPEARASKDGAVRHTRSHPKEQLLAAAAALMNRSSSESMVLVVADDGHERYSGHTPRLQHPARAQAMHVLGGRAIWIDDFIPTWYSVDFDTPTEYFTSARALVELRVCARARRFVGSLSASSTHAVCRWRNEQQAKSTKINGHGRQRSCQDALGRKLPGGWQF